MEQPTFDDALEEACQRRDHGAQFADWSLDSRWRLACEHAIADLAGSGQEFTSDEVTDRVGTALGSPIGGMGAMFRKMAAAGVIQPVGYRQSRRAERHGSVVRVWRGLA